MVWHAITLALSLVAVVQALFLVAVMRQVGRLTVRLGPGRVGAVEHGGPAVGSVVELPGVELAPANVIVFVAPGCGPCEKLIPSLRALYSSYPDVNVAVAVVGGDEPSARRLVDELRELARPALEELFSAWEIPGTPFAIALNDKGRVRMTGVVNNLEHLEVMVAAALEPPNLHELQPLAAVATTNGR
jgi:thiol-disulfide isomerase/thioredoxin